ncbi:hypothetical protein [Enterobacter roggenkampii]|uniref:hypothetical protein n=1 Tax=Enterobacter roggenkampii TaxID=1812935 RepID=UPI002016A812|nr:hypothetical protein [Enterobacter roggenkampii]
MQLEDYISAGRLNIYTDVLKLKPGEELGGYNWNKAVSAAMQPLMHCLEVTLRNAIDYSIRHARLPGAAGHWRTDTNWIFDLPRYIGDKTWIRQNKRYKTDARGQKLMHHGKPVYDRTAWEEDCIRKVSKRIRAAGKAPTAERVISGLDFGFWTNFLTKNYDEPRNRSLLWPQLLPSVFPGAPAGTPVTCWKRNLPVSVTCVTAWRTMKQSGNSGGRSGYRCAGLQPPGIWSSGVPAAVASGMERYAGGSQLAQSCKACCVSGRRSSSAFRGTGHARWFAEFHRTGTADARPERAAQ